MRRAAFGEEPYVLTREFEALLDHFRSHHPFGLRELGMDLALSDWTRKWLGSINSAASSRLFCLAREAAIWPYWVEHMDLLDQALQPATDAWLSNVKRNAFGIIAKAPVPPPQYIDRLWDYAFGLKAERAFLAQESLERGPAILKKFWRNLFQVMRTDAPLQRSGWGD